MNSKNTSILSILAFLLIAGLASADTYNVNLQNSQTLTLNNSINPANLSSLQIEITPSYTHTSPNNIPGLVDYYSCNEGTGVTLTDSTNASNTLNFIGTPTWTNGKRNGGVQFAGSTHTNYKDPFLGSTAFTYVEWIDKTHITYSAPVCDYETGYRNFLIYETSTNGELQFFVGDGTNTNNVVSTGFTDGKWHMLAAVFNASTNELSLYIDGVKTSGTETITHIGNTQAPNNCYMFYYPNQGTYGNCVIDDISEYNRSLTQSEINSLYYDNIQGVTVHSDSNSSTSAVSGSTSVKFGSEDSAISSLIFGVPTTQVINGETVYDYGSTVSPFTATLTQILIPPVVPPVPPTTTSQAAESVKSVLEFLLLMPIFLVFGGISLFMKNQDYKQLSAYIMVGVVTFIMVAVGVVILAFACGV